jgi:purine-binding chemotaxis protein CheW
VEPVPLVASHVAGLFALRSRVMTVIDSNASVGAAPFDRSGHAEAVIVNCDGHGYAILVENVDDVIEPLAGVVQSRAVLSPGWARVALGTIEIDGEALLVVDPEALVSGQQLVAAA